jgi:hypothetical protein
LPKKLTPRIATLPEYGTGGDDHKEKEQRKKKRKASEVFMGKIMII